MLILSGQVETDDLSAIPSLTVHEQNPMRKLYANNFNDTVKNGTDYFTKFIFVRHPFERLAFACHDKLARNNPIYHKMVGKVIVRKIRKNPSRLILKMGDEVTFPFPRINQSICLCDFLSDHFYSQMFSFKNSFHTAKIQSMAFSYADSKLYSQIA